MITFLFFVFWTVHFHNWR